jgi:hypothetical protein
MISGVSKSINGEAHTFRFGARAMMALEDQFDQGVIEIVQNFQTAAEKGSVRMGTLVSMIGECAADGEGVDSAEANRIFDGLGAFGAAELLGQCIDKAFPEARAKPEDDKPAKNRKRAARSK